MEPHFHSEEISLLSFKKELEGYTYDGVKRDLSAGIQVALLALPQAMAYALVAGLPLYCGLYSAIFSSFVAAFLGSSRFLIVGPVNAIALLIQFGVAEILFTSYRGISPAEQEAVVLGILAQLAMLVGLFQVIMGIFKWGRLTQFISHSVVVGYLAGAALAVIINQLFVFLGVEGMPTTGSLYTKAVYLLQNMGGIHYPTMLVGLGSLIMMLMLKQFYPRLPGAVITFAVAGVIIYFLNNITVPPPDLFGIEAGFGAPMVELVGSGDLGDGINVHWAFPPFESRILNDLLPIAFAVTLLSVMESTCVAKSITAISGHHISINQEIFAMGMGNIVSSYIGAMPVSVSPSRSGLNYGLGAQTRLSAIFNALFVAIILHFFGFFVKMIPTTTISALLLITAVNLVNFRQLLLCLKATKADAMVLWATLVACIFFSLDMAFYIGMIISITSYLNKSAVPLLVEFAIEGSGELRSLDAAKAHLQKTIRVIKVEGELFFGAADIFQTTLKAIAENDATTKVIILQLKNARDIDATTCLALLQLHDFLVKSGRRLILCGITSPVWDVLSHSGVIEAIGKENLFLFDERQPLHYMQKAIHRAKELVPA